MENNDSKLYSDIRYLKGIGEKKAKLFNKLGIYTLYDLIYFFPRKYEDRSTFKPISLTMPDETVCIKAMVADTPRLTRIRRGLELVKFRVVDEGGSVDITFFNQSYIQNQFVRGETYVFYGKITFAGSRRTMTNPVHERENAPNGVTGRIVPVYRLTTGISQKALIAAVRQALSDCAGLIPEVLPEAVLKKYSLARAAYCYENIHFPADENALSLARRRLIFEELFVLCCAMSKMGRKNREAAGYTLPPADFDPFWASLPFAPTAAQKRAVSEAAGDLSSSSAMSRLVQGDVGSGKTLVAAALIWHAAKNGFQSAFMAPTEILAQQHLSTLRSLLSPFGLRVEKLTGSMPVKEKRAVKKALAQGEIDLIIGTHALISQDVEYKNLALVITDEQHRFGVDQRAALVSKGRRPHVLVMSATPIPRTLALIIYGDLDVSIIDELPPGRQKVDTFVVDESFRPRLNAFIEKQVFLGRQVFVVCPMIDENEEADIGLKSATEHAQSLQKALPKLRIACIHGKLKPREKDAVMDEFLAGAIDVLVSTTVIEVGVDVPNASLIIIENADRFGLSQLHQLRGRVGRGESKSYCILVSDTKNDDTRERLRVMTKTNDGFKISEEDLRLRGPGDFFGSRQHGLPPLHIADLGAESRTLSEAQEAAETVVASDPELSSPQHLPLSRRVNTLFASASETFN